MNEAKTLGDIIRDQEYAAAREFIRRKYPLTELGATALMEFSLERNEYFRKIAEQAQQIVTAVVNTTVMPPLVVASFRRSSQNQTVSSGVEGAHEGTTADKSVALAESSLSPELSWTDAWIEKLRPRSENCTFCGKPLSDELHHASPGLLACSSLTADDYHRFSGAASPELLPTQLESGTEES